MKKHVTDLCDHMHKVGCEVEWKRKKSVEGTEGATLYI
jgi:hypothetical protein